MVRQIYDYAFTDESLENMVAKISSVLNIYKNLLDFLYFAEDFMQNCAEGNEKVYKNNVLLTIAVLWPAM